MGFISRLSTRISTIWRLCLLFIWLAILWLSSEIKVFAQSETPTATPSPTGWQLFPSSTPAPTINTTCGVGTPVGLGTVTPDLGWRSACYHCLLTLTPMPTFFPTMTPGDINLTLTASLPGYTATQTVAGYTSTATFTPSPTGNTPTPTKTPTPKYYAIRAKNPGNYDFSYYGCTYRYYSWDWGWDPEYLKDQEQGWFATFTKHNGESGNIYWYDPGGNFPYEANPWAGADGGQKCYDDNDGYSECTSYFGITRNGNADIAEDTWDKNSQTYAYVAIYPNCGNTLDGVINDFGIIMYGSNSWKLTPTTTPAWTNTPVPTSSLYCGSVSGYVDDDPFIDILPSPYVLTGGCSEIPAFSIPGWILTILEDLGLDVGDSVDFPGLRLCFDLIQFGNIDLFGVVIHLDTWAAIIGCIALARGIFRS